MRPHSPRREIILAGSGGQGLVLSAVLLAEAALLEGKNAVQTQSYGIASRGGLSLAEVIIDEAEIIFQQVRRPDCVLALTEEAAKKFESWAAEGVPIFYDSTLARERSGPNFHGHPVHPDRQRPGQRGQRQHPGAGDDRRAHRRGAAREPGTCGAPALRRQIGPAQPAGAAGRQRTRRRPGGSRMNTAKTAPCQAACPAGVDVPRYVRHIRDGQFGEALAVVRERIPFPLVCGHACFHPCETKCGRRQFDAPLAIRMLKRVAAEQGWQQQVLPEPAAGERPQGRHRRLRTVRPHRRLLPGAAGPRRHGVRSAGTQRRHVALRHSRLPAVRRDRRCRHRPDRKGGGPDSHRHPRGFGRGAAGAGLRRRAHRLGRLALREDGHSRSRTAPRCWTAWLSSRTSAKGWRRNWANGWWWSAAATRPSMPRG